MKLHRLVVLLLAPVTLPAQHEPKPAPELQKLQLLAGNWEGSGTAVMQPGQPAAEWQARSVYQWVLGGFWLQCDTVVEFPFGAMRLREYLGWDAERKRYVNLAVGNSGEAMLTTAHVGEGEMVLMMHRVQGDHPEVERAATKYGKDKMEFTITFLSAQGPSREGVTGTMKRVDKPVAMPSLDQAAPLAPVAPQMAAIAKMAGVYDGKGEMIMAPGTPPMAIGGRDTMTALFGGAVVMTHTKGTEGMPYEAHGFQAWSAAHGCYKLLSVDSMGMIGDFDAHLHGDKLIATTQGLRMGQPCAARIVMTLDKDGKPAKVVNHSCMGDAPPVQDFTMTYQRGK